MENFDSIHYLNVIAQAIFDKKGFNILALDVRKISSLTDYVIIAEGNVDKHVSAIADEVKQKLQFLGHSPIYSQGLREGDWIVLDYLHIMVHLFTPELRERYQLEQLWKEGQIIDLKIDVNPKSGIQQTH